MVNVVKYLVRFAYFYTRLLGVFNFEIDWKAGRAILTRRTTIYAALMNIIAIGTIPFINVNRLMNAFASRSQSIHQYMFSVMLGGRFFCVSLTLISRWWQRHRIIYIINHLIRLAREKPQVKRLWRRGVVSKFISIFFTEFLQVIISLVVVRDSLSPIVFRSTLLMYAVTALINVIISHYFFAMLNIYGHYLLLNAELRTIMQEIYALEVEHRRGAFVIKSCALADRLEAIARTQYLLQSLVKKTTSLYGVPTLCMSISAYVTSVTTIYMIASELPGTRVSLSWSNWQMEVLFFVEFFFYFLDLHISMSVTYVLQDVHEDVVRLLSQSVVFAPGLDQRLVNVIESFQLQLAWNPLKISILDMYNLEKVNIVAMASSIITSSLVMVQNDIQNS